MKVNQNAILKRCVLRLRLKLVRVFVDLADSGRLFQTIGPATEKLDVCLTCEFTGDIEEMRDTVALLVRHRTCDSQVTRSSHGWITPRGGLDHATYNCVTHQHNLVPAKGQMLFDWEGNRVPGGK